MHPNPGNGRIHAKQFAAAQSLARRSEPGLLGCELAFQDLLVNTSLDGFLLAGYINQCLCQAAKGTKGANCFPKNETISSNAPRTQYILCKKKLWAILRAGNRVIVLANLLRELVIYLQRFVHDPGICRDHTSAVMRPSADR